MKGVGEREKKKVSPQNLFWPMMNTIKFLYIFVVLRYFIETLYPLITLFFSL